MKKLPASINIGGREIKIVVKKLKKAHAEYGADEYTVYIDPETLERDDCEQYLFHELVHAALHVSGVDNILDIRTEEAICWSLQHMLFPVYKRK